MASMNFNDCFFLSMASWYTIASPKHSFLVLHAPSLAKVLAHKVALGCDHYGFGRWFLPLYSLDTIIVVVTSTFGTFLTLRDTNSSKL